MKFFAVTAASLVIFSGIAAATPEPSEASEASVVDFNKRVCTPSKCLCNGLPGQFCGTSTINPDCVTGHVYQCGTDGTTCDYGIRDSCVKCNRLTC